jgi:hypothetical protein
VSSVAWPCAKVRGPTSDAARPPHIVLRLGFDVFIPFGWWALAVLRRWALHGSGFLGEVLSASLSSLSALDHVRCFDVYMCADCEWEL